MDFVINTKSINKQCKCCKSDMNSEIYCDANSAREFFVNVDNIRSEILNESTA